MRALVIHEMYEVLRRHSATVRFRARCSSRHNRDDPYFPAAMRHKPSPPLFPHAIPRFVSSFFTLPLVISLLFSLPPSLSLPGSQIHLPCRRAREASSSSAVSPPRDDASPPRLSLLLRAGTRRGVATIVHRFR